MLPSHKGLCADDIHCLKSCHMFSGFFLNQSHIKMKKAQYNFFRSFGSLTFESTRNLHDGDRNKLLSTYKHIPTKETEQRGGV